MQPEKILTLVVVAVIHEVCSSSPPTGILKIKNRLVAAHFGKKFLKVPTGVCAHAEGRELDDTISVKHRVTLFASAEEKHGLNWNNCTMKMIHERGVAGVTGQGHGNGKSGQTCVTNEDCQFNRATRLKCYKPSCTCQKARLCISSTSRHLNSTVAEIDHRDEFTQRDLSFPDDLEVISGEASLSVVIPLVAVTL